MTHVKGSCIKGTQMSAIAILYHKTWIVFEKWGSICLDVTCMCSHNPSCDRRMPMLVPD